MQDLLNKERETEVASSEQTRNAVTYVPRFDIVETKEEIVLYGDMPGVEPEDIDVSFEEQHLTVLGKVAPRHRDHKHIHGEYGIGDYHREFHVSETIDVEKITAELKNGVLTIQLPKSESVRSRRIEVGGA